MGDPLWAKRARVARYFAGVDAGRLSPAQLAAYDWLIPKTDADEVLRTSGGSLTPDAIRYYVEVATGDPKKAAVEWAKAKLAEAERKADARGR